MNRRTFLLLMLTYGGATFSSSAAHQEYGLAYGSEGTIPAVPSRGVWAWLRMSSTSGEFAVPTSEADYLGHLATIRAAMPLNAGKLQANGEWLQEEPKVNNEWARVLAQQAHAAGQRYMPGATNDREGILVVLDNPVLQLAAAENLVTLACAGRFDSPWDGVFLDLEGVPVSHRQQLSNFHALLATKLRDAGLLVGVSLRGRTADSGDDFQDAYTYDFSILDHVADVVDLRCYNYWRPLPRSISPYWWVQACVAYALSQGVPAAKMTLGVANFSEYWPSTTNNQSDEITYNQAVTLSRKWGIEAAWTESNSNGLVREHFAAKGGESIWIHDALTLMHLCKLADEHGLLGITLFTPGMGNSQQWAVLSKWVFRYMQHLPDVLTYSTAGTIPPEGK